MNNRIILLASAALSAIPVTSAAAQDVAQASESDQTPAESQTSGEVTDIVVTAQRRSQRLQDVPITVFSANAQTLQDNNIQSGEQIGKLVTGVIMTRGNTAIMPFIRGFGTSQRTAPAELSVATYVDGIYVPRLVPAMLDLNNIESIEVLKGPQGTLFGRNSSGGLINIITKTPEPGSDLQGNMEVGFANYSTFTAKGYASTGLGSNVGIDLAFSVSDQGEGWGFNRTTNLDMYYTRSTALRSKLVWEPGADTRVVVGGDYIHYVSTIFPDHYKGRVQGYPGGGAQGLLAQPDKGFYETETDGFEQSRSTNWGVNAKIEHDFSSFSVINTTSYRKGVLNNSVDPEFSKVNWLYQVLAPERSEAFTNELLVQSKGQSRIDWTLGVFYGNILGEYDPSYLAGPGVAGLVGAGNAQVIFGSQRTKTLAGFAQATVKIFSNTNLTLGGRITHDKIEANGNQFIGVGGFPSSVLTPLPNRQLSAEDSYTKFSWRAALDHHLSEDILLYASASSGFKSSNFNILPLTITTPVKPEVSTSYEAGIKTALLDRKLRFNVAGFYSEIENLQVTVLNNAALGITSNIPLLRSYGLEVETEASLTDELRLRAGYSYVNAQYGEYLNAPFFFPNPNPPYGNRPLAPGDATGNWAERAPRHTFNVGVVYDVPVGDDGNKFTFNANLSYVGKFYWQPDNLTVQRPYQLLDSQLKYTFMGGTAHVAIWGANLLDERYYSEAIELGGSAGTVGVPAAPRTFGIKAGINF